MNTHFYEGKKEFREKCKLSQHHKCMADFAIFPFAEDVLGITRQNHNTTNGSN